MKSERDTLDRIIDEAFSKTPYIIGYAMKAYEDAKKTLIAELMQWRFGDKVCPACGREK